jgi:murein DD-endopeptidase MepM/ murein hydrolase activator NlpD
MRAAHRYAAWAPGVLALLLTVLPATDGDAQRVTVATAPVTGEASAANEVPAANEAPIAVRRANPALETPPPERYLSNLMRCRRYRGRRYCEGPRRVPAPHGEAAALAASLELETRRTIQLLLYRDPPEAVLAAVEGETHDELIFPVDEGRLGRGLIRKRGRHPGHEGVDVHAHAGALVRSVESGLVVYSDNGLRGYGNTVVILHADGTVALYAHLQAAYLFAGQAVLAGQVLGEVGETGLARGVHLHFELREGGRPLNPIPRFTAPPQRTAKAER